MLSEGGFKMVIGKAVKDLYNANGNIESGMVCDVLKVWLNNTVGDVYVEIKFRSNDLVMITSISNIEILKK
jgi:hypothetical protein